MGAVSNSRGFDMAEQRVRKEVSRWYESCAIRVCLGMSNPLQLFCVHPHRVSSKSLSHIQLASHSVSHSHQNPLDLPYSACIRTQPCGDFDTIRVARLCVVSSTLTGAVRVSERSRTRGGMLSARSAVHRTMRTCSSSPCYRPLVNHLDTVEQTLTV